MKNRQRMPVIGSAFDSDFRNDAGRCTGYADGLRYYRPRGFSRLARELEAIAARIEADKARPDDGQAMSEAMDEADDILTQWARTRAGHGYIYFGHAPDASCVGFWADIENAQEDADLTLGAGDTVPRGFSGLAVFVTDHGNVSAATFSRGRKTRTLFEVV